MQQSLFCLDRKRKQIKVVGFHDQHASSKVSFHSSGKSQGKRSEENRSRPGADVSCSHLSRLTFGASRSTGEEEDRGCKEREPVTRKQNLLFPHYSLITQSGYFSHQVFIRQLPTPDSHLRQHGGVKTPKRHTKFECFSAVSTVKCRGWAGLLRRPGSLGLRCLEGVL